MLRGLSVALGEMAGPAVESDYMATDDEATVLQKGSMVGVLTSLLRVLLRQPERAFVTGALQQ